MKNLALPRIQAMKAYKPPIDGRSTYKGLLLNFNERTKQPTATLKAIKQHLDNFRPQLYPEYFDLTGIIAKYAGVNSTEVMITNGTDQAIDIIFRTFTDVNDKVVIPEPSFAMFRQAASLSGNRIVNPLYGKNNLSFPTQELLGSVENTVKLIVICNPNNPTGTSVSVSEIEQIAKRACNAIIYVDEAYFEFSKLTVVGLTSKYPNIVISRTFSKAFGLAGLRIGYIVANKRYITEMLKVRGPYDVNQIAYYAASAALKDVSGMKKYANEVMREAKPLVEHFFNENQIHFYQSSGNFILFKPNKPAKVSRVLRENGIAVRSLDKPIIQGTLRLTIGTVEQMKRFIKVYKAAILESRQKYAFLDRDGTLIYEPQDTYQIDSIKKLQILEGVIEGLQQLQRLGYKLILVSNQDGLGTSSFPKANFDAPQNAMLNTFRKVNIKIDACFICPHFKDDDCDCRKPKTGLLEDFLKKRTLDTELSFVCGDRVTDKELARNLGLKFIPMPTNGDFYKTLIQTDIV